MASFRTDYTSVMGEHGLEAKVTNGVIQKTELAKTKTAEEMNSLGKESFLTLLCAQMEYQDPLQPTENTEWISQLATYSSLEQMQNLNVTASNSQAFGMIGQHVVIAKGDENDIASKVEGVVQYVTMQNGRAYVAVDDVLYEADKIQSVLSYDFYQKTEEEKKKAAEAEKNKNNTQSNTKPANNTENTDATRSAEDVTATDETKPAEDVPAADETNSAEENKEESGESESKEAPES